MQWNGQRTQIDIAGAFRTLGGTLSRLPKQRSLFAYLVSSMFYRDALNGLYTFGGIYALGILGWSIVQVGIFGIIGAISGAVFTWVGGYADRAFGPKPVILVCCLVLIGTAMMVVGLTPRSVFGMPIAEGSALPDQLFFNTGISTYIWIVTNKKAKHRKGKVQLINGVGPKLERKLHRLGIYHFEQIAEFTFWSIFENTFVEVNTHLF